MKRLMTVAALAMMAFGCSTHSASTSGLEAVFAKGDYAASVRVDDRTFARRISIEKTLMREASTGFSEANVRVRNHWKKDLPIQYHFAWFDADGMEIQPGSRPWQQTTIHGEETVTLAATAPEKGIVKVIIRLRRI